MNFLFHIDSYNDIDHLAPVANGLLERRENVYFWGSSKILALTDYRILFLSHYDNFHLVHTEDSKNRFWYRGSILLYRLLFNRFSSKCLSLKIRDSIAQFVHKFLLFGQLISRLDISGVIYGWQEPPALSFFFARAQGIPNICLPHGYPMWINLDFNSHIKSIVSSTGNYPNFSFRDLFDVYVVQTERHQKLSIEWRQDPSRVEVWGNARFSKYWSGLNLDLCVAQQPVPTSFSDKNLLLLINAEASHNPSNEVLDLVVEASKIEEIQIGIKGHTRTDGSLGFPWNDVLGLANVHNFPDVPTPALIAWSSVVINYATGTALEALFQRRPLIHAKHLTPNISAFEFSDCVQISHSNAECLDLIVLNLLEPKLPTEYSVSKFLTSEVCGDKQEYEPVDFYCSRIIDICTPKIGD
jgi:hypothetical protein